MPNNEIKTEWNLGLLYKNHKDPKIESDIRNVERLNDQFERKYKNKDFTSSPKKLLWALKDHEKLADQTFGLHAAHYFGLSEDINSDDKYSSSMSIKLHQRLTLSFNKTLFFGLAIEKIPSAMQKNILKDPSFARYKYLLENMFKSAKHSLAEGEEKIMSIKNLPARSLWMKYSDNLLSKQTIEWKKKTLPINEALALISGLQTKDRRELAKKVYETLYTISDFAEAEINAVYTNKKIDDELRHYEHCYDATLLNHQTDEKTVFALNTAVTKGYSISHRFYKLKSKLLDLDHMTYSDRGAKIGNSRKQVSFADALNIVGKAFGAMDRNFSSILDTYVAKGQIDVFPKKGKTGGAYCTSQLNTPTFVLLNHVSDMSSVKTLAHEMGHAIHFEYSRKQPVHYYGCSMATAEVASTFFEEVVFHDFFETLSVQDKILALHDKLNDNISTIFRQIAVFNFELELHALIRKKGSATKEEIARLMNKHMKEYLGPVFNLEEKEGYFFVVWSHIRNFFYVYTYAYGALVSRALYKKYKEDPTYINKVKRFLEGGESKSPHDIFKDIGIDTSDPNFWKEGLKEIEDDIIKLEKLAREAKMI